MKILIYISFIALLLSNCKNEKTKDISQEYPLIERKESLRNGKEWENMHNLYTKLAETIRLKPNDPKAYIEMAELFMVEARVTGEHGHYYPLALKLIEQGQMMGKENKDYQFRAMSDKASVQLSLHQFENAKNTAQEAIKINAYNSQIYGALVDANVELGNYKEAVEMADKMVSIRPDLRSYSRVSYLREIYGDLDGAIEAMKQAVESGYPGYEETAWTRLQLGNLYKKKGDTLQALYQFHKILDERPNYAFAMAAIAEQEMNTNKLDSAEKRIDQAIALMPEVSFYILKSEIKTKQGKEDESMQIAKEVLTMLQADEKAGHKMDLTYARVYDQLFGDEQKALQYGLKEYEIRPNNVEVNKFLTDLYTKMGNVTKATEHHAKSMVEKI